MKPQSKLDAGLHSPCVEKPAAAMMRRPAYTEFLAAKSREVAPAGIVAPAIHGSLFGFQSAIVRWALARGRSAIWADCGLGKTRMALEWAKALVHNGGNALILTPLAVSHQFQMEADELGTPITICRGEGDATKGINVINYERLHKIDTSAFNAVVCDESSILKDYTSATRNMLIETFGRTPYRLALTATPAPNDVMELGNHAEFLGVMSRSEMLAMYFVHDSSETQKWRLKKHARSEFWRWVSEWAVALRSPRDVGHDDAGYDLPPLDVSVHAVDAAHDISTGTLFALPAQTLGDQRKARRDSLPLRLSKVVGLVNASDEPWVVWCDLNIESEEASHAIRGAVQVTGSQSIDEKESIIAGFTAGKYRVIVTKPSICGHGVNWQHCSRVAFLGVSHSFEQWYQAIRRCYRFGQRSPVECHLVVSSREVAVLENLQRKQQDAQTMIGELSQHASL